MFLTCSNEFATTYLNENTNAIEFYSKLTYKYFEAHYEDLIISRSVDKDVRVLEIDEIRLNRYGIFPVPSHRTDISLASENSFIRIGISIHSRQDFVTISIPVHFKPQYPFISGIFPFVDTVSPLVYINTVCTRNSGQIDKRIYLIDWKGNYQLLKDLYLNSNSDKISQFFKDYRSTSLGFSLITSSNINEDARYISKTINIDKNSDVFNKNYYHPTRRGFENTVLQIIMRGRLQRGEDLSDTFDQDGYTRYAFTPSKDAVELFPKFYAPLNAVRYGDYLYFKDKNGLVHQKNRVYVHDWDYEELQNSVMHNVHFYTRNMYLIATNSTYKLHYLKDDVYLEKHLTFFDYKHILGHMYMGFRKYLNEFDERYLRKINRQLPLESKQQYRTRLVYLNKDYEVSVDLAKHTPSICGDGVDEFLRLVKDHTYISKGKICMRLGSLHRFRNYRSEVNKVVDRVLFHVLEYDEWNPDDFTSVSDQDFDLVYEGKDYIEGLKEYKDLGLLEVGNVEYEIDPNTEEEDEQEEQEEQD